MTDLDLTTLKSALKKATAGEWRTQNCQSGGRLLLRDTQMQSHLQIVPAEDAAFIALVHNQLPALIAAYERQRELLYAALPFVESQNLAEGMFDGFGKRKPRPSDAILNLIRDHLKEPSNG